MNLIKKVKNYFTLMEDVPSKQQLIKGFNNDWSFKKLAIISFVISILVALSGLGLTLANNQLPNYEIDYSDCSICTTQKNWNANTVCKCTIKFSIDKPLEFPIYIHYGLKNYFQNLGVFKFSKDYAQFSGAELSEPSSYCVNFRFDGDENPIAPCGDLANTMFNDTFAISYNGLNVPIDVSSIRPMIVESIHNPPLKNGSLKKAFEGFTKPPFWNKNVYELDLNNEDNNGFLNKQFASWMSVEQFSYFRKLYGIIDEKALRNIGLTSLPAGNYQLKIDYNYPISDANFKKSFVIGKAGFIGQQNRPLEYLTYSILAIWLIVLIFALVMMLTKKTHHISL